MSDTPRTDAFHNQTHLSPSSAYAAVLQHARELEREVNRWHEIADERSAEINRLMSLGRGPV